MPNCISVLEPVLSDPQRQNIVFDHSTKEYYNKLTDIYLCDDDILFFGLPPTDLVPFLTKPLAASVAMYLLTHSK